MVMKILIIILFLEIKESKITRGHNYTLTIIMSRLSISSSFLVYCHLRCSLDGNLVKILFKKNLCTDQSRTETGVPSLHSCVFVYH